MSYFVAYCRHHNLDLTHPERSYDDHFHGPAQTLPGYQRLRELNDNCTETVFQTARASITLGPVMDWAQELGVVEAAIQQPDCLLLLFLNRSNFPDRLPSMHSIVVVYDGGFFYFDTSRFPGSIQPGPGHLNDFGDLGDAFIVRRRP